MSLEWDMVIQRALKQLCKSIRSSSTRCQSRNSSAHETSQPHITDTREGFRGHMRKTRRPPAVKPWQHGTPSSRLRLVISSFSGWWSICREDYICQAYEVSRTRTLLYNLTTFCYVHSPNSNFLTFLDHGINDQTAERDVCLTMTRNKRWKKYAAMNNPAWITFIVSYQLR